jgi:hypothetical protein
MTALWWVLWWAVVIGIVTFQFRRALNEPLERDRIIAVASAMASPVSPETEHGTDLALQDECELLWSVPEFTDPRPAAIRDEQQGEARDA